MNNTRKKMEKLSLIVFTGNYDKLHYALATASAALTVNISTTLFFTMDAVKALTKDRFGFGWHYLNSNASISGKERDHELSKLGVAGFEELLAACRDLGAIFMICEMGLRSQSIQQSHLRQDLSYKQGGLVTFLSEETLGGQIVFI